MNLKMANVCLRMSVSVGCMLICFKVNVMSTTWKGLTWSQGQSIGC